MSEELGYTCSCCGQRHGEAALAYHTLAPDYLSPDMTQDESSSLDSELCVIKAEAFFVRGLIEIPVPDTGDVFAWGVWVSLSGPNFARMLELWESPGRESEPPYFGWLSTALPLYAPTTLNLKTRVHTRPLGRRPLVELEPTDHPLAREQREGITQARVREIAELTAHGQR